MAVARGGEKEEEEEEGAAGSSPGAQWLRTLHGAERMEAAAGSGVMSCARPQPGGR